MHELRQRDERPEQRDAEDEAEHTARGDAAIAQHAEINGRLLRNPEFPDEEADERDCGDDAETRYAPVAEPVFLLAFVEHVLQRAEADGEQRDADAVER